MKENSTYRIRTKLGSESDSVVNVQLNQTFDTFEILSLKLDQVNAYKLYESDYGVIVGRVIANGGFGVPNVKVSIFIESEEDENFEKRLLYPYKTMMSTNRDGVRYNLLPDYVDDACHQNVGTFPNKRLLLDNNDVIEIFDKYYKYTTVTNNAGDYMIFGVPTGSQQLHVDVDLSDIGMLSQRPRDMIYKGYNINNFESPNKFKTSTNLDTLAQIYTQDKGVFVYPFWGDTTENSDNIAITRCDIELGYKFEPTCVFMGSIVTDTGSNSISKACAGASGSGKMSELVSGEGTIEMIRKTIDNKVEEFQIKGNRLIDGDGVWCYQIPMNLDYIMTDEFGNIVPSDNPEKGIPTRTRVRFRISLDKVPNDNTARNRCQYLVPNNPRLDPIRYPNFTATKEVDYEFGTNTKDENYRDLLWNKVYTVKNYIPRLQKNTYVQNRKHTGIKLINHFGDNNPMPYNNMMIKLTFSYRLICVIAKVFINLIRFLNQILTLISYPFCMIYNVFRGICKALRKTWILRPVAKPFCLLADWTKKAIPSCMSISSDFCGDNVTHSLTFYPGCGRLMFTNVHMDGECITSKTQDHHEKNEKDLDAEEKTQPTYGTTELYNCVESALAEDHDVVSFNFHNDWVNGVLYAPLWFRKITPKKRLLFGLIKRRAKDDWCSSEVRYDKKLRIFSPCAIRRTSQKEYKNSFGENVKAWFMDKTMKCGKKKDNQQCLKTRSYIGLNNGIIEKRQTMLGEDVYYYKAVEFDNDSRTGSYAKEATPVKEKVGNKEVGSVKLVFATDLVLLGSLNDCDLHGVPQFFKSLESTSFKMPPTLLFTDNVVITKFVSDGNDTSVEYDYSEDGDVEITQESKTEMTGADWGNFNDDLCGKLKDEENQDSGLFYSIGCNSQRTLPKSCINISRICEFGVTLDESKNILSGENPTENGSYDDFYEYLVPDGFISKDELMNDDERTAFATLNSNGLITKINPETGLKEYVFNYTYVDNFDNSLRQSMEERQKRCDKSYRYNFYLEDFSAGYYDFRMGSNPYFYDDENYSEALEKKKIPSGRALPRYENSFYFYFGLKHGKTAIDKFNSQFFSSCYNDGEEINPIGIVAVGSDWCSDIDKYGGNGYVAFDLGMVELPCEIIIQSVSGAQADWTFTATSEKIYISKEPVEELEEKGYVKIVQGYNGRFLKNGVYDVIITDKNGEIITTQFTLRPPFLVTNVNAINFEYSDSELLKMFNGSRNNIKCNRDGLETSPDDIFALNRKIGGTIAIAAPLDGDVNESNPIEYYKIDIQGVKNASGTYEYVTSVSKKDTLDTSGAGCELLYYSNELYFFGLPKCDETYTITITELCKLENGTFVESNNKIIIDVYMREKQPFKLYINDVDHDLISDWLCGFKNDSKTSVDVENDGYPSDNWIHMSDETRYRWYNYIPYQKIDNEMCKTSDNIKNLLSYLKVSGGSTALTPSTFASYFGGSGYGTNFVARYATSESSGHILYTLTEGNELEYDAAKRSNFNQINIDTLIAEIEAFPYDSIEATEEDDADSVGTLRELLEELAEYAQSVITLKEETIYTVKRAFQLNCAEEHKDISFRAVTDDRPVIFHTVYKGEHELDTEDYQTVDRNYTYSESISTINNVTIPTITTKDNELYGGEDQDSLTFYTFESKHTATTVKDELCIARDVRSTYGDTYNKKKAYFVAAVNRNGEGLSIPDRYNTGGPHQYMFGFHIIDKVFDMNALSWAVIDRLPYFRRAKADKYADEYKVKFPGNVDFKDMTQEQRDVFESGYIKMNGLFTAKIKNGSASGYKPCCEECEDETPYLTDFVENVIGTGFKMVIFTDRESGELDSDVEDRMPTNRYVVDGELSENSIQYGDLLNVDSNKNYKNYAIEDGAVGKKMWTNCDKHQQYTPVLPFDSMAVLEDTNDCILEKSVDSEFRIVLSGESVNNCQNSKESKLVLEVEGCTNDEDMIYTVYNYDELDWRDSIVTGDFGKYPLNLAQFNPLTNAYEYDVLCTGNDGHGARIPWGQNAESRKHLEKLFGYYTKMSIKPFFDWHNFSVTAVMKLGDVQTTELLQSNYENTHNETTVENVKGFGTTGEFLFVDHKKTHHPFYAIAITKDNTRTISPVYDFVKVCVKLLFGIVYTKQETIDENGAVSGYTVVESPKMTFDVANVIPRDELHSTENIEDILFYFYNYPYDVSFECKLSDINTVRGSYTHTAYKDNPEGYVLFDMDVAAYNDLDGIERNSNGKVGKRIKNDTKLEVVDVTGLRHIPEWCPSKDGHDCYSNCVAYERHKWITVTWVVNGGTWTKGDCNDYIDVECDCIDDPNNPNYTDECLYGNSTDYVRVFEAGDVYNPYDVGTLVREGCGTLVGWSNSYDSMELVPDANITLQGEPEESMIYYAIWSCDFVTVTWEDCEGNVFATEEGVRIGTLLTNDDMPSSEIENTEFVGWYINYDEQASVHPEFNGTYEVTADTTFRAICGASCKPSLRLINCVDIGKDNIYIVHMTMTVFENAQAAESGTPLKTISIQWGPERMGSPDNPSVNKEDTYRHANAYSEGNVVRIEITAVELSNGCLIYPQDRCIEQLQGVDSDCRADITSAFCMSVDVIQPNDIVIGRACAGSQGKAVITQNGVDCSCTTMHRVVWKWGYDRNEDNLDNDVIKVDYYVCDHDDIMHPQGVTREGCTFNGWKLDGTDDVYDAWDVYTDVTSDLTFIAQWVCEDEPVVEPHTVTFVVGESTIGQPISVNDGEKVNITDIPEDSAVSAFVPEGKIWVDNKWEWWSVVNGNFAPMGTSYTRSEIASDVAITADTRFVAKLENVTPTTTYNVTFKVNTCQIGEVQEVEAGGHAVCPTSEDVEGSECFTEDFDVFENEWRLEGTNQTYNESYINDTYPINATTVFVAVLTRLGECEYDFYWSVPEEVDNKDANGNPITTDSLAHGVIASGSVPTPPTDTPPTLNGFTYGGWLIRGGDGTPFDNNSIPPIMSDTIYDGCWVDTGKRRYRIPWRVENYSSKTLKAGHFTLKVNCPNGLVIESGTDIMFGGDIQPYSGSGDPNERHGSDLVADTMPTDWISLFANTAVVTCQVGNNTVDVTWTRDSGLLVTNTYFRTGNNQTLVVKLYDTAPSYPVTFNAVDLDGNFIKEISSPNVAVATTLDDSIIPSESYICSYASPTGMGVAYRFVTWEDDPHGDVVWSALTYNAKLERKQYNVTFIWDGDNPSNLIVRSILHGEYADTVEPSPSLAPVKTGYTFSGWNPVPAETQVKSPDVVFVGVWTPDAPDTVNITFIAEEQNSSPVVSWTIDTLPNVVIGHVLTQNEVPTEQEILAATDNANAYTFVSWEGGQSPAGTEVSASTTSFKAYVKKKTFTVTFKVKDDDSGSVIGSDISSMTVPYGYALSSSDLPSNSEILNATGNPDAYSLDDLYWKVGNSYTDFDNGTTVEIVTNRTVYAMVTKKFFTVKYVHNNGTGTETNVTPLPYYGDVIEIIAAPQYTNHTFDGWESNLNHNLYQPGASYTVQNNVVFTGHWTDVTPGPYTVNFYGDNSTLIEAQTVQYGQHATPPSVSTAEGRKFKNAWVRRSNSQTVYNSDFTTYEINTNMDFDAVIVNEYKVRFQTPSYVAIISSQWIEENSTVQNNGLPTYQQVTAKASEEGLTYMGNANGEYNGEGAWRLNGPQLTTQTYTNTQITAYPITEETTFYARFSCVVTFDYGSHSSQSATVFSVEKRTYLSASQIPTPQQQYIDANYVFTGWSGDTSERIMDNTTFTAQWEEQPTATVTWNVSYETVNGTMTTVLCRTNEFDNLPYTLQSSDVPGNDTLKGATGEYAAFSGGDNTPTWSPRNPVGAVINGDTTFTATLMRNTFNVSFKICDDTTLPYDANPVKYGQTIDMNLVPEAETENCTLNPINPWNPSLTTPVTSNIIFTASCDCQGEMETYQVKTRVTNNTTGYSINSIKVFLWVSTGGSGQESETTIGAGGGITPNGGYHDGSDFKADKFPSNWAYFQARRAIVTFDQHSPMEITLNDTGVGYKLTSTIFSISDYGTSKVFEITVEEV